MAWSFDALPAVLALGMLVVWTWMDGGYATTTWLPGALFIAALLATVCVLDRAHFGNRLISGSLLFLGAFTAWSYLTMLWADEKGIAWDGSNRTLLYFCIFALVVARPWSGRATSALIGACSLAIAVIFGIHIAQATSGSDPSAYFILGRLASPIGYSNAEAALALMAFWPLVFFASRRETPLLLRGTLLASSGLLLETAILCQSRSMLVALPASALVYLVVAPNRLRSVIPLVPVGVVGGLATPLLTPVYLAVLHGIDEGAALNDARHAIARSVVALFLVGSLLAGVDRFAKISPRAVRWMSLAALALALVGAGSAATAAIVRYGDPVSRLQQGWRHFESGRRNDYTRSRLDAGLGSPRYDVWKVALTEFSRHPWGGIGTDNFSVQYLRQRKTTVEPLYPHSLELRVLSQTGIVGSALFAGFLLCVSAAWWRARRSASPSERCATVAAGMVVVYWVVHGSVDWFWEVPALGGLAFVALGLAIRTGSERAAVSAPSDGRARVWVKAGLVAASLVAGASLTLPWIAARDVQLAASGWPSDPALAFSRLDTARRLNPLSDEPDVTAGVIASRIGDRGKEREAFERAVGRNPWNWYAHYELGVVNALAGARVVAVRSFVAAERLNPSEPIIRSVRQRVAHGRVVDFPAIEREFAGRASPLERHSGQSPNH